MLLQASYSLKINLNHHDNLLPVLEHQSEDNSFLLLYNFTHLIANEVSLDLQKVIVHFKSFVFLPPIFLFSLYLLNLLIIFAASHVFLPRKLRSSRIYGLSKHLSQDSQHFSCPIVNIVLRYTL